MFHHVNWTWVPPGGKGNVCERCGSHCFCTAESGLLPKTRSAVAAAKAAQQLPVQQNLNPLVAHPQLPVQQDFNPAVAPPQEGQQDGIAAILMYDSDSD